MSRTRQVDPRANQKARTRTAIVEAAQQLQRQGEVPTIARTATSAGVSRATAYRYFPTQEALLVELHVLPVAAEVDKALDNLTTDDVEKRLLLLLDTFDELALVDEEHQRRILWVSLDTWLRNNGNDNGNPVSVREGRRIRWLDQVLMPLDDLPEDEKHRLRAALALTIGMDALVIMKDICGLTNEEARAVLRWATTTLLRAGLTEHHSRIQAAASLDVDRK